MPVCMLSLAQHREVRPEVECAGAPKDIGRAICSRAARQEERHSLGKRRGLFAVWAREGVPQMRGTDLLKACADRRACLIWFSLPKEFLHSVVECVANLVSGEDVVHDEHLPVGKQCAEVSFIK